MTTWRLGRDSRQLTGRLVTVAVLAVVGAVLCGCDNREGYGCIPATEDLCHQFVSSDGDVLDESKAHCLERDQEVADSCPTEDIVGCCLNEPSSTDAIYDCFYAPTHTAEDVRAKCEEAHTAFVETFFEEE